MQDYEHRAVTLADGIVNEGRHTVSEWCISVLDSEAPVGTRQWWADLADALEVGTREHDHLRPEQRDWLTYQVALARKRANTPPGVTLGPSRTAPLRTGTVDDESPAWNRTIGWIG